MTENRCKPNLPKVGIAVPNLNQGRYLRDCLNSLNVQQGIDLRICVLDAGSTDDSLEIIREYDKKGLLAGWRSHSDNGQAAAINEGAQWLVDCDFFGWLNADDVLVEGALAIMAQALFENPKAASVYGLAWILAEDGSIIRDYPTEPFDVDRLAKGCFICQPATLIRMSAWQKVGGLNAELEMCMDYDLWWKLKDIGELIYIPKRLAGSRDHPLTKTRRKVGQHLQEAQAILRKYYGRVPYQWRMAEVIHEWEQYHQRKPVTVFERIYIKMMYLKKIFL
ncbi:glycosyltransferase [Heliobacterium gestii]|uniref:Glycosyltransferase n=1 Tax=Heliomicrobium gestii TaxID=2699 RepID=A0A845LJR3_HELGE|nr:glycosyltransferase [Heliomicrobium gestii]MBM7866614.1 glycosyltransferase involved in cell wall biosynthesis [Heliomicrobium gestii]MZP43106.1 glycosyltransferase [Heliomicrobium gestii]